MEKSKFEFFGLRRNALVITITSLFLSIGRTLVQTFIYSYAMHLGAPIIVLGLYGTIQGLSRIFLVAPLGYLGDRVGHHRKWIVATCDALSALAYFTYAAANSWIWLIPGIILETGIPLANPALSAILADSINPEKRGVAYATRTLTIMIGRAFAPFLGGLLLDSMGMEHGMYVLFIIGGLENCWYSG